jgi:RNA polymerase sigma-70 factor (family 1)
MEREEKMLLSRLKTDDQLAFNEIYHGYWQKLYRHTCRKIKSNEIAEEIVHDIFADLWFRRHTIEITISLNAYLFQSASYLAYRHIKKLKNKDIFINEMAKVMEGEVYTAHHQSEYAELNQMLTSSLSLLPDRCRTVFEMSRFRQLSHREISEEMQITVKTVENQITKALRILKVSLKDYVLIFLFVLLQ